eukprot:TRINITY_DN3619_c0_g1_i1.p1 TRINITY_DN3619_c0_g1~~TRINITY_DN3619_c0_g1_i1.p1  ORF type:complete len:438 (-),score=57.59 TRINITY_DN3619_c0_g1_i1:400-1713(-)
MSLPRVRFAAVCVPVLLLFTRARAHGLMTIPPQRGALNPANKFNRGGGIWNDAPSDLKAHFPAGDKDDAPGAAARSQLRRANNNWVPFEPLNPNFRWRAGVCGDPVGSEQQHMRGGRFYYGAQITATWTQGDTVSTEVNIVAHHNGFMQFHICDVAKCGGEISEDCFRDGHCYALRRAPNADCDSGFDKQCAPIDRNYPLRWYLPCATKPENSQERMGNEKMQWILPPDLVCEHCVLHWFWSAANTCNPPGVIPFYDGPDRPRNWGQCFGQSGARGGVTRVQKPCGPTRNPEEYYQCADVKIVPRSGANTDVQRSQPEPVSADTVEDAVTGNSVLTNVQLVADGNVVQVLGSDSVIDVSKYDKLTLEVVATREISKVDFYIDESLMWTDWTARYFMYGNKGNNPNYWPDPIFNRKFKLRVSADEEGDAIELQLTLNK